MIPFIQRSVDTLAEILKKEADADKSLDVYRCIQAHTFTDTYMTLYIPTHTKSFVELINFVNVCVDMHVLLWCSNI